MKILTNMQFWQSRAWSEATNSIYPRHRLPFGKKPLSPAREAVALWRGAHGFDVVVTMGARESLAYGWLCLISGRSSKQVMTEIFVDDLNASNPLWRLKLTLYRRIAMNCIGILTNSSAEIETIADRFHIPKTKLAYVPMHTNIMRPQAAEADDGFILSAGFTHRDYPCLIRAAKDLPARIVILCGREEKLPAAIPPNVDILRDRSREEYLDLLRRCSFVVLPLKPTPRATGQVVLLEAMALGKAVVANRAPGVLDHIRQGENGLLFDAGDSDTLTAYCRELLENPTKTDGLGQQALNDVMQFNTIETHAENRLKAIQVLWEKSFLVLSS